MPSYELKAHVWTQLAQSTSAFAIHVSTKMAIHVSTKMAVKFYDFGKFGRGSALIFEIFGIYFSFVLKWSSMPSLEKNYFGSISVSIIWNNPNISMHFLRKFFRFLFIYIFTDWLNQFGSWLAHTAWQEYSTTQTLSFLIFPNLLHSISKPFISQLGNFDFIIY